MNEIGEILKEARIEKGYTLDDLQQTTKIQKRYLQAIEVGNTEILPGRFYARAFVKQYADIVGLDGEQLLEEHLDETSKEASEQFAEKVSVSPTRSTNVKRGGTTKNVLQENLPTILIFLLVAAIFVVIYFAWRQADNADQAENALINEQNTEQVEPPVTEESNEEAADESTEETTDATTDETEDAEEEETEEEPEAQEISIAESSGSTTTYQINGPHPEEQTLVLAASGGSSWVSVNVDGGSEQAQLLEDGDELSVNFGADATEVSIIVGNAPATNVTLNEIEVPVAPEASNAVRQDLLLQFSGE